MDDKIDEIIWEWIHDIEKNKRLANTSEKPYRL
jgi:hypothetical protein